MTFEDILRDVYKYLTPYKGYTNAPANLYRVRQDIIKLFTNWRDTGYVRAYTISCDDSINPIPKDKNPIHLIRMGIGATMLDGSVTRAVIIIQSDVYIYIGWDPKATLGSKTSNPKDAYDRAMKGI